MKIKLGILGVIVVLLAGLMPVPVLAKNDKDAGWIQFTAVANMTITWPGTTEPENPTPPSLPPPLLRVKTLGEIIIGQIECTEWPAIDGALLTLVHNADSTLNLAAGSFVGKGMTGDNISTITLEKPVGNVLMEGTYEANLHGKLILREDGSFAYPQVVDIGKWELIKDGAVFALGEAHVTLVPTADGSTLAGIMELSGRHR